MAYSKSFPRTVENSNYPRWEEIYLAEHEEKEAEALARSENIALMKECIKDAKDIVQELSLKEFQSNVVDIAIALFDKRASHTVYHKESKAKEKFDKKH